MAVAEVAPAALVVTVTGTLVPAATPVRSSRMVRCAVPVGRTQAAPGKQAAIPQSATGAPATVSVAGPGGAAWAVRTPLAAAPPSAPTPAVTSTLALSPA